jgi:hypothetical protein
LIEYHKQEIKEKTTIANGRATKNIDRTPTKTNQEKTTSANMEMNCNEILASMCEE